MKPSLSLSVLALFGGCIAVAPAPINNGYPSQQPNNYPPAYGPTVGVSVSVHVDFFGVPLDNCQDVVFVLDRSGSMSGVSAGISGQAVGMSRTGSMLAAATATIANDAAGGVLPSKMQAAKAELIRTLNALPYGTRFNVIFFDEQVAELSPTMLTMDPSTREGAIRFISGIEEGGSTAAAPAMHAAYSIGAQRVVLLSDGLANTGGSADALLREAREQMRHGLRIDTVGLGINQDSELLRTLAAESGGVMMMR